MFDAIYNPEVWVVSAALMAAIWYKNRRTGHEAFRDGALAGLLLGADRTIKILVEQELIDKRDAFGIKPSKAELVKLVGPIVAAKLTDEFNLDEV